MNQACSPFTRTSRGGFKIGSKTVTLLFASLLAASFCGLAQEKKDQPASVYPTDVRVEVDTAFLPEDRKEKADLYFPLQRSPQSRSAAVVVIHGGGFNDGDKARGREINIARTLALHGYVAMSINYKLRKMKGQVTWPQSVHDAKTAVRWLRKNADLLGVDPDRIGVIGCSAGGNLAAMLATTGPADGLDPAGPYAEFSASVKCAVDFYGAVDLMNYHDMKMFAKTREEAPELYKKGSPVTYVDAKDAPLLIVHGTADDTVPLSQSETLAAALRTAGVEHELVVIPDAPHTFHLELKDRDLRPLVLGFFSKHLGTPTVTVEKNLTYLAPGRQEKLDLYQPAGRGPDVRSPAVVIIHGGGWIQGDKGAEREVLTGTILAKAGYVCISIEYWKKEKDRWPTNLQDCKNAVRWLRVHAERLQIDPGKIGVIGGSAGGHLALMVAYTAGFSGLDPGPLYAGVSDHVSACVNMYGISNLLTRQGTDETGMPNGKLSDTRLLNESREADLEKWKAASPVTYIRRTSPPTLTLHGTGDTTVDRGQSIELDRTLTAAGAESQLIMVEGANHAWPLKTSKFDHTGEVVAFFDKHLK